MIKLSVTGVGTDDTAFVTDRNGTGLLPVQADGDGVTTFRVLGRVTSEAPWAELKAADTVDFLESISWVPQLRLEVTSGSGTVNLYIGSK